MPLQIDPKVDFVFKLLLGDPRQKGLLIDFLNAILCLPEPVAEVEIQNPYNERDYENDKLSVVDVLATDTRGARFQVEIQLIVHRALRERILYGWASGYADQLHDGEDYERLAPTYSIWLLDDTLLKGSQAHHHRFLAYDPIRQVQLSSQLDIHLIELPKWGPPGELPLTPEQRWLYFFQEASSWDTLPSQLNDPTMRQAMSVLEGVSQRTQDLARYRARQDAKRMEMLRERNDREREQLAETQAELAAAQAALEVADSRLEQTSSKLEQTSSKLEQTSSKLEQTSSKLEQTSSKLEQTSSALEQKSILLNQAQREAEALRQRLRDAGLDPDA